MYANVSKWFHFFRKTGPNYTSDGAVSPFNDSSNSIHTSSCHAAPSPARGYRPILLFIQKSDHFPQIFHPLGTNDIHIYHSTPSLLGTLILGANWLIAFKSCLKSLLIQSQKVNRMCSKNIFRKTVSFRHHLKIYRQLQIGSIISNQVIYYILPVAKLILFLCCITLSCLIIKFYYFIPIPMTVMGTSLVVVLGGVPHFIFPIMAYLNVNSKGLVRLWKLEASKRKVIWTKEVNSYGPIRAFVGPFYFMDQNTRTDFFAAIFYYTASLVISVRLYVE